MADQDASVEILGSNDVEVVEVSIPGQRGPAGGVVSIEGQTGTLTLAGIGGISQTSGDARYLLQTSVGAASGAASLDAGGLVPLAQLPALPAALVTSGTFDPARIPALDASKVTTGTFTAAQIPALDAAKITTGTFDIALIPTGTTSSTVAVGNHSHGFDTATGDTRYILLTDKNAAGGVAGLTAGGTILQSVVPLLDISSIPVGTTHTTVAYGDHTHTSSSSTDVPLATVTTKGDLIAGTGASSVTRLPVGANNYVLVADSTQTMGLRWQALGSAPVGVSDSQTLTNKTISAATNTFFNIPDSAIVGLSTSKLTGTIAVTQLASPVENFFYGVSGPVAVKTGALGVPLAVAYTFDSLRLRVGTAPVGSSLIIDVKKNGTTIYSTVAKPSIAAGAVTGTGATPDVTTFAAGDYITVDVTQVGSTTTGSDLVVALRLKRTS